MVNDAIYHCSLTHSYCYFHFTKSLSFQTCKVLSFIEQKANFKYFNATHFIQYNNSSTTSYKNEKEKHHGKSIQHVLHL